MNFIIIYSTFFNVIQYILLPVLKWQGKKVKKSALKLPEATGNKSGITGSGKLIKILFIGDSSVCGVGVKNIKQSLSGNLITNLKDEYQCKWKIIAKSGLNTSNLIDLILLEKEEKFQIVIISVGMNDITSRNSLKLWLRNLNKMENILFNNFSADALIYSGMPPVHKLYLLPNPLRYILSKKALLFDYSLKTKCMQLKKYEYVNINNLSYGKEMVAIDGFHPNEQFYKIWAKEISKIIEKINII